MQNIFYNKYNTIVLLLLLVCFISDIFAQNNNIFKGSDSAGYRVECYSQGTPASPPAATNNTIFVGSGDAGYVYECYSQSPTTGPSTAGNNSIFVGSSAGGYVKECYSQGVTTSTTASNNGIYIGGLTSGNIVSCSADSIPLENCSAGVAIDSMLTTNTACPASSDGTAKVFYGGGTGPFTFQWNDPSLQTDTTATGLFQGVYQVIVRGSDNCLDAFSDTVKSNSSIVAVITGEDTICSGDSTLLVAAGGTTYLWSTGATNDSIYVSPSADSTFLVTATTGGCADDDSIRIVINPIPTASITGNDTICYGDSTQLNAFPATGMTYLWNNGSTIDSIRVSPPADSTYVVTVTNSYNCSDTGFIDLTVLPLPDASITMTADSVCNGDSTTLTALPNGMANYDWSTGATTQSIKVAPGTDSTYAVTVTDTYTCNDTTSQIIYVLTITSNIAGTTTICNGESTTLTASGGSDYLWSTTATNAAIDVSPTADSTFAVTVSDVFGTHSCSDSSASALVTVDPAVTASISAASDTICLEDSVTFTALPAGMTYNWNTSATTQSIKISPSTTTVYTVTVTNTFSCTDEASQTLTVLTSTASISGVTTIYIGDSTDLTASGGDTYVWSTTETTTTINVKPIADSTFYVIATKVYGTFSCDDSTAVDVIVRDSASRSIFIGGSAAGIVKDCFSQSGTSASPASNNVIYSGGSYSGYLFECFSQNPSSTPTTTGNNNLFAGSSNSGYMVVCYAQNDPAGPVPLPMNNNIMFGGSYDGDSVKCGGTYTTLEGPLPIGLLRFDAFRIGDEVKTEWLTATEINNNYFTIEKSFPEYGKEKKLNKLKWQIVDIVPAAGNSSTTLYYSTIDKTPFPKGTDRTGLILYYRLKQTDFDGQYEYFRIVAVDFSGEKRQSIIIFPNPTRGKTAIKFIGMKKQSAHLEIANLLGAKVFEKNIVINENEFLYELSETEHLSQGIYYLKAMLNDKIYIERLVVQ